MKRPESLDVIVTTNLFGDMISDEAAQLVGGLGIASGANMGGNYAMFEPVHGSAPKYAGQDKVNPIAIVFAGKMLLEYIGERDSPHELESATFEVLKEGRTLTYDLGGKAKSSEMCEAILEKIRRP